MVTTGADNNGEMEISRRDIEKLKSFFPGIKRNLFCKTSEDDPLYNCIAWALEEKDKFYWPKRGNFWPKDLPCEETLETFISLFQTKGYEICDSGDLEEVYKKIAIYTDKEGVPTHASRQLKTGKWTSKLGQNIDIEHNLHLLTSNEFESLYGEIALFMKKERDG